MEKEITSKVKPIAHQRSLITDQWMDKLTNGLTWEEDLGAS